MSAYNFVRSGPKFRNIVFVNAVYTLSLFSSVPEILVLKLESCRKSHRFLNGFASPNFKGDGAPKTVLALTPQPRGTSSAKVSFGYTH